MNGMEIERGRAGFCAILGLPNVGKSTLLNRLLGRSVVAVSPKPQTTRNRVVGVHNTTAIDPDSGEANSAQIVFIDTPGVQRGGSGLRRYMREQAISAATECDLAAVLVDATAAAQQSPRTLPRPAAEALAEVLAAVNGPVLLALNKIDRIGDKNRLLPMIDAYSGTGLYRAIVPISARTGEGTAELAAAITRFLPTGPMLFPEDMYTDRPEEFLAAELIREQLFVHLGKEVPYATAVMVESFCERQNDIVIGAVIYVERESQKGIVVGSRGGRIKQVGEKARAVIAGLLGCPVHLKLLVKVAANWSRDRHGLRRMGYE